MKPMGHSLYPYFAGISQEKDHTKWRGPEFTYRGITTKCFYIKENYEKMRKSSCHVFNEKALQGLACSSCPIGKVKLEIGSSITIVAEWIDDE